MTAGPGPAGPPRRPLPEMTTRELSRYRRELDQALKGRPIGDPGRERLQQQLTIVNAILQVRAEAQPGGPPPGIARPLRPGTYDLTARIFRGLFTDFDLHHLSGGYLAIPKGTPLFTGHSLGALARQISQATSHDHPGPGPASGPR